MRRLHTTLAALLTAAAALVLVTTAGADNVTVSVSTVTLAPGGSTSVSYSIAATGGDGCDAAVTPVEVTLTPTGPVNLSTSSLVFTECSVGQSVTVSAAASAADGSYDVTPAVSDPAYNTNPGKLTVTVATPPPLDTTPPTLSLPGPLSAEATSPGGAVVTYTATATDDVDGAIGVSCSPSSGATFPKGQTTVSCSAQDAAGNTTQGSFSVTVVDTQPPALIVPANFTTEATSAAGAVVMLAVSANDVVDGSRPVLCTPASGSTFPIAETNVTCTASDTSANSASGSFTVTVADTQPPTLTLPAPITTPATGLAGASVSFAASANDTVDGARPVACTPASDSTFPVGATTVTCTTSDTHGNNASGTFGVTVTNAAPTVVVPASQTVEANGPSGSTVTFTPAPAASDTVDGPLPVACLPASGSLFPLGTTTVTCTAVDSFGASAGASFAVSVVDTTPPTLTVPPDATFVSDNGGPLPRSSSELAAYLARGRAEDAVDPQPTLYVNIPDFFPLGVTDVLYTAIDAAGNGSTGTTRITVIPPPPPGTPRPTPPPEDPPPARVTNVRVLPGNGTLRLTWRPSADADVARYAAFRAERNGPEVQAYNGAAPSFTDRGLVNGVEYRYVIVAYDRAGNRSVGVAVTGIPRRPMLLRPQDRARVRAGQVFTWRAVSSARYYNFQLFRVLTAGGVQRLQKVLSVWPVTNRFRLSATWRFEGRRYRLAAGTYRWFVWPGFGARADARYGVVLGERTFVVAPRR